MSNGLSARDLSHDPAVVQAYETDPLVHRVATARWFTEATTAMQSTLADASRLKVPVLFLHGGADPITSPAATRTVYNPAGTQDRTHHEYPGLYHEIYNENGKEAVFQDIENWLSGRI